MAVNNRIFISFAMEDERFRTFLVGQARNEKSPFSFVDMSVKQPWDTQWKANCRTKIKGCDGMIALVSKNTTQATGQLWEIECAKSEGIPTHGIYINSNDRPDFLPNELSGVRVVDWSWVNIASFINGL